MSEEEKNVYKNIFEYPTKIIAKLELDNEQLQQENQQLKDKLEQLDRDNTATLVLLNEENKELKNIINKAIEYIKNHSLYEMEYDYSDKENIQLLGANDDIAVNGLLEILNKANIKKSE